MEKRSRFYSQDGDETEVENDYDEKTLVNSVLTTKPSEFEKSSSFRSSMEMRNDASFCDVAFLVQGCLFRAHKIIVSSWSRWLFALLSEGPDQEIVSLDVFTPSEFGAVLDYMYGDPLYFNLENSENMLKVIRRLEMRALEQKCWKHLMSIIDTSNCQQLHSLADYFDCAPLKVASWRLIQESKPGYSAAPSELLDAMNALAASRGGSARYGHGLTGPGENPDPLSEDRGDDEYDNDSDEDDADIFSIFTSTTPGANGKEGLLSSSLRKYNHYVRPDQLPRGTPAAEVVRAWAFRLQEVYNECCEAGADMTAYQRERRDPRLNGNGREGNRRRTQSGGSGVDRRYDGIDHGDDESEGGTVTFHGVPRMQSKGSLSTIQKQTSKDSYISNAEYGPPSSGSVRRMASQESMQSDITMDSPTRTPAQTIAQPRGSALLQQSHFARTKARESSARLPVFEEKDDESSVDTRQQSGINWKSELGKFYRARGLPEKLSSLDEILEAWEGKEVEMMEVLHNKYNIPMPPDLTMKIKQMQQEQ